MQAAGIASQRQLEVCALGQVEAGSSVELTPDDWAALQLMLQQTVVSLHYLPK